MGIKVSYSENSENLFMHSIYLGSLWPSWLGRSYLFSLQRQPVLHWRLARKRWGRNLQIADNWGCPGGGSCKCFKINISMHYNDNLIWYQAAHLQGALGAGLGLMVRIPFSSSVFLSSGILINFTFWPRICTFTCFPGSDERLDFQLGILVTAEVSGGHFNPTIRF